MKWMLSAFLVLIGISNSAQAQLIHDGGGGIYYCYENHWQSDKDFIVISVSEMLGTSYSATYYHENGLKEDGFGLRPPQYGSSDSNVLVEFKHWRFSFSYFDLVVFKERNDVGYDKGYKAILTVGSERKTEAFNCRPGEEMDKELSSTP